MPSRLEEAFTLVGVRGRSSGAVRLIPSAFDNGQGNKMMNGYLPVLANVHSPLGRLVAHFVRKNLEDGPLVRG